MGMPWLEKHEHWIDWRDKGIGASRTAVSDRALVTDTNGLTSFERVIALIQNQAIVSNNSTCSQASVWFQLAVALDHFGNNGTGASLDRSQDLRGIGKGTADGYTDRDVQALKNLSVRYVRWPTVAERRKTFHEREAVGFAGCVGFIGGTTIPLTQNPVIDGECFFD
ncbi:Hypothetical protein PHPALM_4651 [Phytophthora palmivora]|uniref:Uncharacterized protein n=1 Tax=Phytophthora palmivora TaxID=4796 RepID=A0A2P4YJC1_9STRA|nr:Hypothetical protein PHPALM_4651 [Phytophthora palmivora]